MQEVYHKCMDFAFMQVSTGAADYNTAIRQATKNLADQGVYVIEYGSGVHTSLEAAVRRNVMGGLGLMQEQISQRTHDDLGADGWEIDAHSNSAPDHEPIQGHQYSDADYAALNNSLIRRIGTLNCGHSAHPIILGVSPPQYSPEELEQMRQMNETGITYNGRHYTGYAATQRQRRLEAAMRRQKRKILVDEAAGNAEALQADQIRLQIQRQEYARFSRAAGLRTQTERAEAVNFGWKQAGAVSTAYDKVANAANAMYNIGSEEENVKTYMRDLPIRRKIKAGTIPGNIEAGQQRKHIPGTLEYRQYVEKFQRKNQYGPSRVSLSIEEIEALLQKFKGTGILRGKYLENDWVGTETITMNEKIIGIVVNNQNGTEAETPVFKIHYGPKGAHVVPDYPSKKGAKARS